MGLLVGNYVCRHDPRTNEISVVVDSFNRFNGLAFSPDESVVYNNDSGAIQQRDVGDFSFGGCRITCCI